jgi:hypothetical protein
VANVTALARKFKVEVSTVYPAVPTSGDWSQVIGISDLTPKVDPTMQDADDYDSDGWGRSEKTFQKWSLELTFFRKKDGVSGDYNAAQEIIRAAEDQFGDGSRVEVRWYDRDGGPEAFQGVANVQWERANSGVTDLDAAKVTLTGDGPRTTISNPAA